MGTIFIFLTCFVVPFGLLGVLVKKNKRCLMVFGIGALTFFISQMILRLPLLGWWESQASTQIWIRENVIIYTLLLCFSAGLFEETGRLIGFKVLKKTNTLIEAIAFGLGHGGIEALLLVGIPTLGSSVSLYNAILIGGERLAAILIHVTLSIIIFIGVKKHHAVLYLALAIMLHGLFNLIPTVLISITGNVVMGECVIYILSILIFIGVYFLIIKEWIRNEKVF